MVKLNVLNMNIKEAITNCTKSINALLELDKRDMIILGDVSDKIDEVINTKNKQIVEEHKKYCGIWQGKDGRWKTKVPDKTAKEGRRLLSCATEAILENSIVKFYEERLVCITTLKTIYNDWISSKEDETSSANIYKLQYFWNKYYKDNAIVDVPIDELTVGRIKGFLNNTVNSQSLTLRQYKDMKSVINMMLDYAVDHEIIEVNKARSIRKAPKSKLILPTKKPVNEIVYFDEVEAEAISKAEELFDKTGNTAYLAICLNFYLGLRAGELVALETTDIKKNKLHIRKGEIQNYVKDKKGHLHRQGVKVVAHTKTSSGIREIVLTDEAMGYINKALEYNRENGFKDGNYIFLDKKGKRKHSDGIENALRHVNGTRNERDGYDIVGRPKGNHSIRRTYISRLGASGLPDVIITGLAGHKDIGTTRKHYMYPTNTIDDYADAIAQSLKVKPRKTNSRL